MKLYRKQAVGIGILFLTAMASYMVGSELTASSVNSANQFTNINMNFLQFGIILEFINSAAVLGIAVLFHRILKTYSETTSILYVLSRSLEAFLLLICSVCTLTIALTNPQNVQVVAPYLFSMRELLFQTAMIALGAGSIFMCQTLFTSRLIPRPLSILGIVGYTALLLSGLLSLFGYHQFGMMLFIPGALFEIAFPLWLFWKGFTPKAPNGRLTDSV